MSAAPVATLDGRRWTALNRELAEWLHRPPVDLEFGAEAALRDDLIVCGLVGGKDVGKSTLLTALTRLPPGAPGPAVGAGTERPMAFVHEAARARFEQRLANAQRSGALDVAAHGIDELREVVLVDLPDFDSEFRAHEETVRHVLPRLDRVLWILTPRKLGDRIWMEWTARALKDADNVRFVVNKADELIADLSPAETTRGMDPEENGRAFWRAQHQWIVDSLARLGFTSPEEHRFLVSAAFPDPDSFVRRIGEQWNDPAWTRFGGERGTITTIARLAAAELARLRAAVLAPCSRERAAAIKRANQSFEWTGLTNRLRAHYGLDELSDRLRAACDAEAVQELLNGCFGESFCARTADSLRARMRPDTELADQLLQERIESWPLLPIVYWPFGWLARLIARRTNAAPPGAAAPAGELWNADGLTLQNRVEAFRSRLLAENAGLVSELRLEPLCPTADELTARVSRAAGTLVPRLESRCLKKVAEGARKPSPLAKAALWVILLWFPIGQPALLTVLEAWTEPISSMLPRLAVRLVSAMSAPHLLSSLAMAAAVYVAVLAVMYRRRLKAVRRALGESDSSALPPGKHAARRDDQEQTEHGGSTAAQDVDALLAEEVVAPLMAPFQDSLRRVSIIQEELSATESGS
jgi:hypothetical protein